MRYLCHNCVALIPQYVLRRERLFFDTTGNTGLQTQGASNVLAGVIAGLLGQGYQSITAAVLGLHLVGLSAELYAGRYSERQSHGDELDRPPGRSLSSARGEVGFLFRVIGLRIAI